VPSMFQPSSAGTHDPMSGNIAAKATADNQVAQWSKDIRAQKFRVDIRAHHSSIAATRTSAAIVEAHEGS
jgi:hypothetical protein